MSDQGDASGSARENQQTGSVTWDDGGQKKEGYYRYDVSDEGEADIQEGSLICNEELSVSSDVEYSDQAS